ncbi:MULTISPECIES: ABC transporter permease [Acidobacteriaceae]|uniref:ABC transporter permease n=1 Tax=Acidobacteriaceae TaxID=204434 RepID=UPI00131AE3C8|nr:MULTISPECIES: ABC transporter permease [Acidobacteriaceae]MDW5265647.1 ABC transporter permease [Edaphobacter sp.]
MNKIHEVLRRLRMLFYRKQFQADLEEEMRLHLELREQEQTDEGVASSESRRAAYRRFGNPTSLKEKSYTAWGWGWLEGLMQDARFALRQLWKAPGFTVTVILTLALGIGANAAIFTLVKAVLLKNLPVVDPRALVRVGDRADCCQNSGPNQDGDYSMFSTDTYQQMKKNTPEFEELAAMQAGFENRPVVIRRDGGQDAPKPRMGEFVSGNYFRMFGLQPVTGRLLSDTDDVAGAPLVAVMSYATWRGVYNGDDSVVGSTFWMNTKAVTVVGVAPEGFYGDRISSTPPDFYLPIATMPDEAGGKSMRDPAQNWLDIIGRVKPGVALAPLQEKLSAQLKRVYATYPDFSAADIAKTHLVLTAGGAGTQSMQENYASNLKLLIWIAALVLMIACANIANLLLVRGMQRKTEMSVRTALGAMRSRIVRQLLTENLLLAGVGGITALAVSYGGARLLLMLAFPGDQHVPISSRPSTEVLLFAMCVSMATGVLFGLAPALIGAKAPPADALRNGTRTTTGGASLLQRGLVVLQAALSVVLLVGAALFSQSLGRLQHTDMKLQSKNRYIVHINAQAAGYKDEQVNALYRLLEERFHAISDVVKVGVSTYTPMEGNNDGYGIQLVGQPNLHKSATNIIVNSEYFDSVGTRVLMGRGITVQDTATSPHVAVVNEDFVKALFKPGENPIGHRFTAGGDPAKPYEIVGVVQGTSYTDVRWNGAHPMYFGPLTQPSEAGYAGAIVVETAHPISDMESIARRTLMEINPNLAMQKFETFDAQIAGRFTHEQMLSTLMTLFGGLALLLATVGLYGVTSYTVARRTSEIGIRMALGADRSGVVAMILRSALLQTLLGLAIGIPVAFYGVTLVKSQLYELTTVSNGALVAAVGILLAAACVAGIIPARRAASVDPVRALRTD